MQPSHAALPPGWSALALEEIDSTNSEAMRRAAVGERGPLWITARSQTRGRGRSGRAWASTDASLAATLLFSPDCPVPALGGLSLVAGVAAHDAISASLPVASCAAVRLKWPNDVLIERAKVSGILVETSIFGHEAVAIVGTGININASPEIAGRETTALSKHGAQVGVDELGALLATALSRWLALWARGAGFVAVREAWLARGGAIGERLSVNVEGSLVTGSYAGLDEDGGLLLDVGRGQTRKFSFGDVALASPTV